MQSSQAVSSEFMLFFSRKQVRSAFVIGAQFMTQNILRAIRIGQYMILEYRAWCKSKLTLIMCKYDRLKTTINCIRQRLFAKELKSTKIRNEYTIHITLISDLRYGLIYLLFNTVSTLVQLNSELLLHNLLLDGSNKGTSTLSNDNHCGRDAI